MRQSSFARFLISASLLTALAGSVGGCAAIASRDVTGSTAVSETPRSEAQWRKYSEIYGERYRADPKDADAGLHYGQALRALGQYQQSVAVLEQATIANPNNLRLLAAYGRALADNGNYQQAFDTLARAHTPDNPDWSILSVQGTALDRLGKHEEARQYYASALKIRPDEPSVLSNLGMSYVLSKDLAHAEETLSKAYAGAGHNAKIQQNLALVIGLRGRSAEAEEIARAGLPAEEAEANVASLRDLLRDYHANPRNANAMMPPRS